MQEDQRCALRVSESAGRLRPRPGHDLGLISPFHPSLLGI